MDEWFKQGNTNACTLIALAILVHAHSGVLIDWRRMYLERFRNTGIAFDEACQAINAEHDTSLRRVVISDEEALRTFLRRYSRFAFFFRRVTDRRLRRRAVRSVEQCAHAYCAIKRADDLCVNAVDGYSHVSGAYVFGLDDLSEQLEFGPFEAVVLDDGGILHRT